MARRSKRLAPQPSPAPAQFRRLDCGAGFFGSLRGAGFALCARTSSSGKSSIGLDQVRTVLSNSEKCFWPAISGFGITMKRRCHRAAAATARRGKRFSTQASLKKLLERNFRDSTERSNAPDKLLEKL